MIDSVSDRSLEILVCSVALTVIVVVADNQFLQFAVLAHLAPHILIERIEVVLQLTGVHLALWVVGWVLIHVGHQDRLGVRWLDMFAGASVTVSAGANLVVEGAIDLVLFCTENGSEIVGHDDQPTVEWTRVVEVEGRRRGGKKTARWHEDERREKDKGGKEMVG
jgi:hypothetical protein